jgi:hypothetical protein
MQSRLVSAAAFLGSLGIGGIILTASPCAAQSSDAALIARFVGTWQEDVSKRKVGSMAPLRFERNATGGLQELRGPDARPAIQPVVFDGQPRRPDAGPNTIAWKQVDPNTFERVLTDGARTLTTRRIRITSDGQTLTEATEQKLGDGGTRVNTIVYQRVSGDPQGLVGVWKPQSFKTDAPGVQKYEAAGTNALKISAANNTLADATYTVALDGKPVAVVGAGTIPGTMIAAKRVDDYTIEFTNSREGVTTGKSVRKVSPDGKIMTVTNTNLGPNASAEPTIIVNVKQ